MSEPVILLGTQSNGETLPVQVNEFGQLVAEGLQGQDGPPGPEGPAGPEGPSFELPPDPYEGALLGWKGDQLAWVGTPPVVIPEGVFGPIVSLDGNNFITVEGGIPEQLGNGVWLTQVNAQGVPVATNPAWNIEKDWNAAPVYQNPGSPAYGNFYVENAFNGLTTDKALPAAGTSWEWIFDCFDEVSSFKLWWDNDTNNIWINGERGNRIDPLKNNPMDLSGVMSSLDSIKIEYDQVGGFTFLAQIEVNGKILIDRGFGEVRGQVQQIVNDEQLQVSNATLDYFAVGNYLKIDEGQRVAPWLLYGVDPTSRIDLLRSSRD